MKILRYWLEILCAVAISALLIGVIGTGIVELQETRAKNQAAIQDLTSWGNYLMIDENGKKFTVRRVR